MASRLTPKDVERLLQDRSADNRAATAGKIAREFSQDRLSRDERKIAEDIFRVLMRDAEVRVRESLSVHVRESRTLPHDVAVTLAKDVDQVALPMLNFSEVLTEHDLIDIVKSTGSAKQEAVAKRKRVGPKLADALVDSGDEKVVATLVANEGAEIEEGALAKALDRWGESEIVNSPMTHRKSLPISIAERLVFLVSEGLRDHLVTHHDLSPSLAADLVLQSRERATMALLSSDTDALDVAELVQQLHGNGRLTPTILFRATCMGDMAFFEEAIATLAKVPVINTRLLIHDSGKLGLKGIYQKAGLPDTFYEAFRVAVDVCRETSYDGEERDRERYSRRVIERILTQFDDFDSENLEYIVAKLGKLSEVARPLSAVAG